MDRFFDWLASSAPWLLPLLFVLTLTFLIVPVAARNGYNDVIGDAPKFAEIVTADKGPSESKEPKPQLRPVPRSNFDAHESAPRLGLWAEALSASISHEARVTLTTLIVVVIAVGAALMHGAGLRPFLIPHRYLLLTFAVVAVGFLVVLIATSWVGYTVPLRLRALAEGLETTGAPAAAKESSIFVSLYTSLHGVPRDGRQESQPNWSNLSRAEHHVAGLGRITLRSLFVLVLLSALLASALKTGGRLNPAHPGAVLGALLVSVVLAVHAVQWFWLADSYGRLLVAPRELRKWTLTPRGSIEAADLAPYWPFPFSADKEYALGSSGTLVFTLRNVFPLGDQSLKFKAFGEGRGLDEFEVSRQDLERRPPSNKHLLSLARNSFGTLADDIDFTRPGPGGCEPDVAVTVSEGQSYSLLTLCVSTSPIPVSEAQ